MSYLSVLITEISIINIIFTDPKFPSGELEITSVNSEAQRQQLH